MVIWTRIDIVKGKLLTTTTTALETLKLEL